MEKLREISEEEELSIFELADNVLTAYVDEYEFCPEESELEDENESSDCDSEEDIEEDSPDEEDLDDTED